MSDFSRLGVLLPYYEQGEASLGMPIDQLIFISIMAISVVCSIFFRRLESPNIRHYVSIILGLLFCFIQYGVVSTIGLVAFVIFHYYLILSVPAGWVGVSAMLILSIAHIYRLWVDYMGWRLDATASLMLMTVKIFTCAYDIQDGIRIKRKETLHKKEHIAKQRMERAIDKPSFLEFFSYAFFFPGVIAGPVYNIKVFLDFINMRNDFFGTQEISTWKAVLLCLRHTVVTVILHKVIGGIYFPHEPIFTDWFLSKSLFIRFHYLVISAVLYRMKYFFVWYFAEVSCVACGFGVRKKKSKDGEVVVQYDAARNGFALRTETARNIGQMLGSWNVMVSDWLKHYIYLRVTAPKGIPQKSWAVLVTRTTSAFWHGFYPGYYLAFMCSAILDEFATSSKRNVWPHVKNSLWGRRVYTALGMYGTMCGINVIGFSFAALSWERSIFMWNAVYYLAHIGSVCGVIIMSFIPKKKGISE